MVKQYQYKVNVQDLCKWLTLPRSNYYYQPSDGIRGFKASVNTFKLDGSSVSNTAVVEDIKSILSGEFVCYGYQKVTLELKNKEYVINHKKVYRLMEENNLLLGKTIQTTGKREWVKHRKIEATKPMDYLCLDIKYLWIAGEKRYYYLLTILDVYSRKVIEWILQRSVKKIDVINLFRSINLKHGIKGVHIRNDNGSQFIANDVRQFLRAAEAKQEFTHIATPEENSYIEAYHSILQAEVVNRFEFDGYYEAKLTIQAYVDFYNNRRIHRGIGGKKPQQLWDEYAILNKKYNFESSGEAEMGNAGEQPIRNILLDGDKLEGECKNTPSAPNFNLSLSGYASKNSTFRVKQPKQILK
jgi:putative transposase